MKRNIKPVKHIFFDAPAIRYFRSCVQKYYPVVLLQMQNMHTQDLELKSTLRRRSSGVKAEREMLQLGLNPVLVSFKGTVHSKIVCVFSFLFFLF